MHDIILSIIITHVVYFMYGKVTITLLHVHRFPFFFFFIKRQTS